MSRILVTGMASGLGAALHQQLKEDGHYLYPDTDIDFGFDVREAGVYSDVQVQELDVLINCAGVNRIDWLADADEADWDDMMNTNAKGIFLMAQEYQARLRESKGTIVNIVSNAAHMPMRCSAAYNASKGAALILTKQLARELSPDITVFSISPNKLAGTGMSDSIDKQVCETRGWTLEEAQKYQLQGLLTGEETPVANLVNFISFLLATKGNHKYLTGCDIPYGA